MRRWGARLYLCLLLIATLVQPPGPPPRPVLGPAAAAPATTAPEPAPATTAPEPAPAATPPEPPTPESAPAAAATHSPAAAEPFRTTPGWWSSAAMGPPAPAPRVQVLVYHHIQDPSDGPVTITPAQFESHLAWLREQGYPILSLAEFEAVLARRLNPGPRSVLITFDDGYASFYTQALPLLRRYAAPAVIFIVMGWLQTDGPGRYLSQVQARELLDSGLVAVQGHSYLGHTQIPVGPEGLHGPFLTRKMWLGSRLETAGEFAGRVRSDLVQTRTALQRLGVPADQALHLAWPFGDYGQKQGDGTPPALAREAGFQFLYTGDPCIVTPDTSPNAVGRVNTGVHWMSRPYFQQRVEWWFANGGSC